MIHKSHDMEIALVRLLDMLLTNPDVKESTRVCAVICTCKGLNCENSVAFQLITYQSAILACFY